MITALPPLPAPDPCLRPQMHMRTVLPAWATTAYMLARGRVLVPQADAVRSGAGACTLATLARLLGPLPLAPCCLCAGTAALLEPELRRLPAGCDIGQREGGAPRAGAPVKGTHLAPCSLISWCPATALQAGRREPGAS